MTAERPLIIVTRKLPDVVETRLRELFDARLNLEDRPFSRDELIDAVKKANVLVPTVTDRIDRSVLSQAGPNLKLIAQFGTGVDNIDLETARNRSIIVTNTPGVLTEDTADMTMALIIAVPRRLTEGASLLRPTAMNGMAGRRPGCSAIASTARGSALSAWAASARRWRSGQGLRLADPLSQPAARRARDRAGVGGDLLGQPRPDARPHGHHLGELPAHARDLPFALGAAARGDEAHPPISSTRRAAR